MKVYLLQYHWESLDDDGTEIIGVYGWNNIEVARDTMRSEAASVKKEYEEKYNGTWKWDDDVTWEYENSIQLYNEQGSSSQSVTVHTWFIIEFVVQE